MAYEVFITKTCTCCGYNARASSFVQLSEEYGSIEICELCLNRLIRVLDSNRQRHDQIYKEKRARREQKVFKKFMKQRGRSDSPTNSESLGCLIAFLVIVILFILFINYAQEW